MLPPLREPSQESIPKPDSPLYGTTSLDSLLAGSAFSNDAILLLQFMRDLTQSTGQENSPLVKAIKGKTSNLPSDPLCKIIHATSAIYCGAFTQPPIPFSSEVNSGPLAVISTCLEDPTNDDIWKEHPGIFLWIVLTAMSAAVNDLKCGFLSLWVLRIGTWAAWWGTREARAAMMTFLRVKRKSEGLADIEESV